MTVWIGHLQWNRDNGFPLDRDPVLEPLDTIRNMDAILDETDPENPAEPSWEDVDYIVGNPPFLGGKKLRRELHRRITSIGSFPFGVIALDPRRTSAAIGSRRPDDRSSLGNVFAPVFSPRKGFAVGRVDTA